MILEIVIVKNDVTCVGFQEIFEQPALYAVVAEANRRGQTLNDEVIPDRSKKYRRKVLCKLGPLLLCFGHSNKLRFMGSSEFWPIVAHSRRAQTGPDDALGAYSRRGRTNQ